MMMVRDGRDTLEQPLSLVDGRDNITALHLSPMKNVIL